MTRCIILDSSPLGLLVQKAGFARVRDCHVWLDRHRAAGCSVIVPDIVDYELRRELLRLGATGALRRLDLLYASPDVTRLQLTREALARAAELWAQARQQGRPTTDPHALDIDVILAAQVLTSGLALAETMVATSNPSHLSLFLPAEQWDRI